MKTVEQLAVDEQIIRDYGAILSYAAKNDAPIEDFNLSTRSYNCLKCNEIDTFYKMVSIYPDGYTRIRNMGVKSFEEINNTILRYFTDGSIKSQAEGEEYQNTQKENFNVELLSVLQLLKHSNTKDRAWDYIYKNDIEVALMNLSNRSTHALLNAGLVKFSSILKVYPVQTAFLKGLGAKSVNEINSSILSNLERIESCVRAYCLGDVQALYSDEYIKKTILDQFEDKDFAGLSFLDIRGEFPENIDENRIKRIIGTLIRDNVLE